MAAATATDASAQHAAWRGRSGRHRHPDAEGRELRSRVPAAPSMAGRNVAQGGPGGEPRSGHDPAKPGQSFRGRSGAWQHSTTVVVMALSNHRVLANSAVRQHNLAGRFACRFKEPGLMS
jgi:hypothetical protein